MTRVICFFSSVGKIGHFRVAHESFRRFHSDIPVYLLLCDDPKLSNSLNLPSDVNVITYDNCLAPNIPEALLKYGYQSGLMRLMIIKHVMNLGYKKIICLDSDMEIFDTLDNIYYKLDRNDIIVTPHISDPLPNDGLHPSMEGLVSAGNYNSAFYACNSSTQSRNFLDWWYEISLLKGDLSPRDNHFAEQGWLRFVGDFVDNVLVLRDSGYNVAYWNVMQRDLQLLNEKWHTKDGPLVIYHHSGLENASKMSKYQNRYLAAGTYKEFLQSYLDRTQ